MLAAVTDGEGRRWTYTYGAFDVLQAIEDPKGGRLSFAYDGEGRVTAVTNQMGVTYRLIRAPKRRRVSCAKARGSCHSGRRAGLRR